MLLGLLQSMKHLNLILKILIRSKKETINAKYKDVFSRYFKWQSKQKLKASDPRPFKFKPPGLSQSLSALNFSDMVGLPRVSFLIVTSCALSFASRRLRSVPISASFVFCK
jgi:hypothetical protein